MAELPLTVKSDYVNWTIWQAIRELLQNAKDAQDAEGADMEVDYYPRSNRLEIINRGVTIDRSRLILGSTSKRGDSSQRGEFGEGFKLAFATLCRLDREVTMDVGKERWRPTIGQSDDFDGEEVIIINTRKLQKERDHIRVEIDPVTPKEWDTIRRRTAFLGDALETIETTAGHIIKDEPGKVFQKGLYVDTVDNMKWGYDLPDVDIDRDRSMVREYDVRMDVREIIDRAYRNDQLEASTIYAILKEDTHFEASALSRHTSYGDDPLSEGVAESFQDDHGPDAVPVTTTSESKEAEHYGLKGIPVSRPLNNILQNTDSGFKDQVNDRQVVIEKRYSAMDLPTDCYSGLQSCIKRIRAIDGVPNFAWSVVDFADPQIEGEAREGHVLLSRSIIDDPARRLATLAHEVAHLDGAHDFTVAHRNATEMLLARLATGGASHEQ